MIGRIDLHGNADIMSRQEPDWQTRAPDLGRFAEIVYKAPVETAPLRASRLTVVIATRLPRPPGMRADAPLILQGVYQ